MPAKKADDLDEIKKSLGFITAEISELVKQQTKLVGLVEEVRMLKLAMKEKDKKITDLERRLDDLEQYSRMDDLLISGLSTTHKTYSRAVAGDNGEEATPTEQDSLEKQLLDFFEGQNMNLQADLDMSYTP